VKPSTSVRVAHHDQLHVDVEVAVEEAVVAAE